MTTLVYESTGKSPEIDDGLYTFQITEVTAGVRQSDEYGHAGEPTLTFKCLIMGVVDEDGEDIYLDPMVSLKYKRPGKTQASNLFLYAQAAGIAPPTGEPLDWTRFEGRMLQGLITTPEGKWPRIEPKSLMPVKAVKGQPVAMSQKAQEAPSEAADSPPWQETDALADAEALAQWFDRMDELGLKRKDVNDASLDLYGKPPRDLTAAEREQLAKSLTA